MSPLRALLVALVALAAGPSLARADDGPTVFAASSLTDVVTRVAERWVAEGHPRPVLRFDASSRLAVQIAEGAPADVFLSADEEWMDYVKDHGRMAEGTRALLAGNSLVLVIAADRTGTDPQKILEGARRVALGGENVPVGRHARAALGTLGWWDRVKAKVVNGQNARQALEFVARGEADAGLVYRTDALSDARVKVVFDVPASSHPRISYAGAVVKRPGAKAEAVAFLVYLQGEAARADWRATGFVLPSDPR